MKESSRKWCKRNYLEEQRLYEIAKLRKQFRDILVDSKLISAADADEDERRQVKKEKKLGSPSCFLLSFSLLFALLSPFIFSSFAFEYNESVTFLISSSSLRTLDRMWNSGTGEENKPAAFLALNFVSYKSNKPKTEVKKKHTEKARDVYLLTDLSGRRLLRFEDEMKEANENATAETEDEQPDDEDIDLRSN